jgi:RNA 2',3'-cyclic 3'-phosphodiesterase
MATSAEEHLRLFVGLELPHPARAELARLVDPFRGADGIRWARSEDYHLTLRFIGPTPTDRIPALLDVLARVAAEARRRDIEVGGFDAFPGGGRPARVLVARVEDTTGDLADLASAITANVPGRTGAAFTPHVTLGRCSPPRPVPQGWRSIHPRSGRLAVLEVALFASHAGTGGVRYEVLGTVPWGR